MGCLLAFRSRRKKHGQFTNKYAASSEDYSTVLPEPKSRGPSIQSAPPSFRTRGRPAQSVNETTNDRTRALSAPSSIHVQDREAEFEGHTAFARVGDVKHHCISNPRPLPLPSPQGISFVKSMGSLKSNAAGGSLLTSGPLPLPPLSGGGLRNFSFEEISTACQNFSADWCVSEGNFTSVYSASLGDDLSSKKLEATVTRFLPSSHGLKEFVSKINTLASLQCPQLCKLLGFHAREGSNQRMLVYERLHHGNLECLLRGGSEGPSIDWCSRMKVAICAAKGLAFLHEEGPFQAMYNEFSTVNIQVDKDFTAKLSGYGCVAYNPETDLSNASAISNLFMETREKRGLLTPKSNVWSFGVILLELLTGKKNSDSRPHKEERNIVNWSRPFLADDCRLSLIMDPRIKGRFPAKAARIVADIALKCLLKDPSERPTMRTVVDALKSVQDIKYHRRFPLQEPSAVAGKQTVEPFAIISHPSLPKFSSSPSLKVPPRSVSSPVQLPPRTCAYTVTEDDGASIGAVVKSSFSALRRPGVEGF